MMKSQGLEGFSVLESEGDVVCEYPVNPLKRFAGFEAKHTPINPIGERDEKIQDTHDLEDI